MNLGAHVLDERLLPSFDAALAELVGKAEAYRARLAVLHAAGETVLGQAVESYELCWSAIAAHYDFIGSLRRLEGIARCITRPAGCDTPLMPAAAGAN